MTFEESEAARLNKQATALKKAGDMPGAIAALRRVKALQSELYQDTRLAKFLQQAGQLDAALVEIQWLLDRSQAQAQASLGHQSSSVIQCQHAGWCARIHADAALICKRAKRSDLQAQHELLRGRYASIRERLQPVVRAESKAKFSAWEEAKKQGIKAMQAFHETHYQAHKKW